MRNKPLIPKSAKSSARYLSNSPQEIMDDINNVPLSEIYSTFKGRMVYDGLTLKSLLRQSELSTAQKMECEEKRRLAYIRDRILAEERKAKKEKKRLA